MVDLEKIKTEIAELDVKIQKATSELWEVINKNKKGLDMKTKIALSNKRNEIAVLRLNRDKKVYEYHNYFNPFKSIIIICLFFGALFCITPATNFELHQSVLAISELGSNHSGGYIRTGQQSRLQVYVEPIENTTITSAEFDISGCGYNQTTLAGFASGDDPNVIYSEVIVPNVTLTTTNQGQNERCLLYVNISVIDSNSQNYEKEFQYYVGNVITGCEYSANCTVGSFTGRGYYYYDNINITGTLTLTRPTNTNYIGYVYFVTKGNTIINAVSGSGGAARSCPDEYTGQSAGRLYIYSPYIEIGTITASGGNGRTCKDQTGGSGGSGGYFYLYSSIETRLKNTITMNGGNGDGGGSVPVDSNGQDGGSGGNGGKLYFYSLNNTNTIVNRTTGTITMTGGYGDDGSAGKDDGSYWSSPGGDGGTGGDTGEMYFYNIGYAYIGGSTITMSAGDGGDGGSSACHTSSCGGADGGDSGYIFPLFYRVSNSNLFLNTTVLHLGNDGGRGRSECGSGTEGRGGSADNMITKAFVYGNLTILQPYNIKMGNGGDSGGSSSYDGCQGGCRRYTTGPNITVYGMFEVRNTINCTSGSSGRTTDCYSLPSNWTLAYNDTQITALHNFSKFLPTYTNATQITSNTKIEENFSLSVENITMRINNFTENIYTLTIPENTTEVEFFLYNATSGLLLQKIDNYTSFSGYEEDEYYIKTIQCGGNSNGTYCVRNNSNNFYIYKIPTNITGYTDPGTLSNLTNTTFMVYCEYFSTTNTGINWCYQESANVSNQSGTDTCAGLNYSGSYDFNCSGIGSCDEDAAYDGNWSSGSGINSNIGNLTINYTLPQVVNNSIWQTKDDYGIYNFTLPTECLTEELVQLKVFSDGNWIERWLNFSCLNSSDDWVNLGKGNQDTIAPSIYEEGLYFTTSENVSANISNAVVEVEMDTEEELMTESSGVYEYNNTKYLTSSGVIEIYCRGNKRDFSESYEWVNNLTLSGIMVEKPYGNPLTYCLFPNQKNVEPVYQSPIRYIMRIVNLQNETKNISVSFNYPLPSSIKHGIIQGNFSWNWSNYLLLNTTPQEFIINLNAYDGTQNVSNYSARLWVLTNCTNANPGEDILNYTGDYVFVVSE